MAVVGSLFPIRWRKDTAIHLLRNFSFFIPIYILLVFCARNISSRDPGSVFFRPWTAYDFSYSALRLQQSDAFIQDIKEMAQNETARSSSHPELCVGVATVARQGIRYFKSTVGSLLEGLSEEERSGINLILFIAHTNASEHPAYAEPWLFKVADNVLLYDPQTVDIDHIRTLETDTAKVHGREKPLFDYTYLLEACAATNAPYIAMIEDDVVAQDGWYHKTLEAIESADKQTMQIGAPNCTSAPLFSNDLFEGWLSHIANSSILLLGLYLRLFYTEEFFGWNSEFWFTYLTASISFVALAAGLCVAARSYETRFRTYLSNANIFLVSVVCVPLLIGLVFATGRVTVHPLPAGVHQMPRFGCCSQAFVFPRPRIPDLLDLYRSKRVGYVDMITEEFADANNEIRWALQPAIMQHVGRQSSKGISTGVTGPTRHTYKEELSEVEKLWNFGFELNDVDKLRAEHEKVIDKGYGWTE
ncbi:hypothetical protein N7528_002627 [Penicillium herquei]|nr:hypothetical protein N7528_002627 [Penicillium herquei]